VFRVKEGCFVIVLELDIIRILGFGGIDSEDRGCDGELANCH
jgi:hypothetical protein